MSPPSHQTAPFHRWCTSRRTDASMSPWGILSMRPAELYDRWEEGLFLKKAPIVDPPSVIPKTHSVAMATARDAIVAFGAGHGALSVPVERRITRYFWQERFYAVGGFDRDENKVVRNCRGYGTHLSLVRCPGRRMGGGGPDVERPTWTWYCVDRW